jgi:ABC-type glycerol-3-phosphate transport system substrate-binding protein
MDHPNEVASSLEQRPPVWVDTLASPLLANEATSFFSNYSYFPFPVSDGPNGSSNTTPVISTCIVASSGTQYKEPAWKWINFLSQQLINTDTGATNNGWVIPARQSVAQNNEIWNSIPENAKSLIEFSVEHAWFGSKVPSMTYLVNSTLTNPNTTSQSLEKDFANLFAETPIVAPTENRTPVFVEPFQTDEKSSEQLTIKFYTSVTNENEERWESLVNQFHETHSTINITLPPANEGIPLVDDYEEYLSNNYDCFVWNTDDMLNSQGTQNLVDISPLLSIENSSFVNDFDKETLGSYEFNNYLLGLPTSTELTLISYNEDLLQELGISEPYEDWDYSEFIRLANIVSTKPGYYGFLFASWDVDFFLSSQNASLIPDPSRLSVAINSPEIKSAVQEFLGLVKTNTFFPLTGDRQNSVEAQQLITSGKVAFWTSTSGNPENWYFLQNNGSIFNIGINPLPVTSQPITQSTTANLGAFISKKGDNQQVCWEWIKFLSENSTSLDGIPLRNSVRDSSNWEATVGSKNAEIYRIAYEQGEFRKYNWKIVGVIQGIFLQALYSILDGKDISSELYTSQAKADQFLNCISPYVNSFSDSIDQAVLDQCSLQ